MTNIHIEHTPNPQFPEVADAAPEWVQKHHQHVALIDVRSPEEFVGELGHIPGAELLVLDDLPKRLHELPADRPIVFICRSGMRSAKAALLAKSEGHNEVYNLRGGMLLWNELGLPTQMTPIIR